MPVSLNYGHHARFDCDVADERVVAHFAAPAPTAHLAAEIASALETPLDFPPLAQLCVPGDRVVVALDRHTPAAGELVAAVCDVLVRRDIEAEAIHLLQPAAPGDLPTTDPRALLPPEMQSAVRWSVHDPTDPKRHAYLATTARGERIYLARELTDADVVISLGQIEFDSVLGHRGTSSVFYPGLSNAESVVRSRGQGHSELGPDDERPLRQTIDEIAWLLGTQFSIQTLPAAGAAAAGILAGAVDSVFRRGKQFLDRHWRVRLEERVDVVVAAIDADSAGHGWNQLGAALASARNLVIKGGKIVVLSEICGEPEGGMTLIRQSRSPRNALQPIRQQAPLDMIPATQLAGAADWARVYLLSRLDAELVDELFLTPLANEREAGRLLAGNERCVFLESAQHVYGEVMSGSA